MKKILLLLIIFPLGFICKAQSLEGGTFSSFGMDADQLTGTGGEAIVLPVNRNDGLYAGLMEILRSGKIDIEVPTDVEELGDEKIRVYTTESNLMVETVEKYKLQVVTMGGVMVITQEIEGAFSQPLSSGVYIILLTNKTRQNIYKVSIR